MSQRVVPGSSRPLTCAVHIQQEFDANGPVQTGFRVYEDFMQYKSGIYEHPHGEQLSEHVVKIIGWGSEDGKDF